ncbi:hypothetical protein [Kitasatospora sp. NPDC057198]|uniref:hypothetical protein n=1 Tax=Kitasatospora sp. NPDC057198 TaxID=3346046 RepID=UPI00363CB484
MDGNGRAPWGSRRGMRMLALAGGGGTVLLFALALLARAQGNPHWVGLLVIAAALAAFWAVMLPLARRKGKV